MTPSLCASASTFGGSAELNATTLASTVFANVTSACEHGAGDASRPRGDERTRCRTTACARSRGMLWRAITLVGAHLVQRPDGCADELQLDALGGEV